MGYVGQDAQETKLGLLVADADDVSLHTVSRAPGSRPSRISVNLNHVMQIAHIEIGSTMPTYYLILLIIGLIEIAFGLYLLHEARKYRARRRRDEQGRLGSGNESCTITPYMVSSHLRTEEEMAPYVQACPELDIASEGDTVEESVDNLLEAVELYFLGNEPLRS